MQAPIKEIRDIYLNEHDIEVLIINEGKNPKDEMGYNKNFQADYSGVKYTQILQNFKPEIFYSIFPKVLVPARFQGFHKGHKVVLEEAKRLSPNITIGLRVDNEDIINLNENINLLESKGYKTIKTPNINENWVNFANEYDIYVQGNPTVIKKFIDSKCELYFVPRYGDVSGTSIRKNLKDNINNIDYDVLK